MRAPTARPRSVARVRSLVHRRAQRETIMNGKLFATLDLNTLAGHAHLYGLGPLEQLRVR
jgi:hypothetical protein